MSLSFVKEIIELPYGQQLTHWARPRPWFKDGAGVRMRVPQRLTARDAVANEDGTVTRVRQPVDRPCFGMPTAFLFHHRDNYVWSNGGKLVPAHCSPKRCPAAEACAKVAKLRLLATPVIAAAYNEFERAGGVAVLELDRKAGLPSRAGHRLRDLLSALDAHGPFQDANYDRLCREVALKSEQIKVVERERKAQKRAAERAARIKDGALDQSFQDRLRREAIFRRILFDQARAQPDAPAWLRTGPPDQGAFTAMVWKATMILRSLGSEVNAHSTAAHLLSTGQVQDITLGALRNGRVKTALDRIHRLEQGIGTPRPIWPKVTVDELLVDDEIDVAALAA